ncbi:unnamed protein product, partial [Meganyctiphanes norvegica]
MPNVFELSSVVLLACVCISLAAPQYHPAPYGHPAPVYKHKARPYSYQYGVKSPYHGTDFGADESSDGNVVKGSYTVVLPDGRTQKVTYTADHYAGYNADVSYSGYAQYPKPAPYHPQPYHHAPPPYHG